MSEATIDFSKYINLLLEKPEPYDDPTEFCKTLFVNRNFHRIISFVQEKCKKEELNDTIRYWYLISLIKLRHYKEAEIYIKENYPNYEKNSKILYVSGLIALKQLDFENSIEKLSKSFVLDPTFFEPIHCLLKHHLIIESKLRAIIKRSKCSEKQAAKIMQYASISWLYYGDPQQAFDIASDLMKKDPSSDRAITAYVSACLALKKQQDLFVVAQRLLETAPNSYLSSFAAGCHISMSGRSDAARALLWFTLRRMPSFAPAWLAYALTYKTDNDYRMALQVAMTASRAFPRLDLLHLWSAYFCCQTNEFAPALAHLQMCKQTGYVMNEVGCILMSLGRVKDAVKAFKKSISSNDVCTTYIINCATALRRAGNLDEAEKLYRDALKKEPDNETCLIGLAFTLQLSDKLNECIDLYNHALFISPQNAFAKEMLQHAVETLATEPFDVDSVVGENNEFEKQFQSFMKK